MKKLPIGTRVRFTKTLEDIGELGRVFATDGETGVILGYEANEGYWVETDKQQSPFGATRQEFEPL